MARAMAHVEEHGVIVAVRQDDEAGAGPFAAAEGAVEADEQTVTRRKPSLAAWCSIQRSGLCGSPAWDDAVASRRRGGGVKVELDFRADQRRTSTSLMKMPRPMRAPP